MSTHPNRLKEDAQSPHYDKSEISGWKNPYILYILLTAALFGLLVVMAWIGQKMDLVPNR